MFTNAVKATFLTVALCAIAAVVLLKYSALAIAWAYRKATR